MEMIEQSLIVSEVASKLEEHARKAMKGRGISRARGAVSGVVTPPWAASSKFNIDSRGLITYDDEYVNEEEPTVITDDGSLDSISNSLSSRETSSDSKVDAKLVTSPPVSDTETVERVGNEIRRRASQNFVNSEAIQACASVAEFFMSTAPGEDADEVSKKILQLLASSGKLSVDFHFYRAALHPGSTNDAPVQRQQQFDQQDVLSLRRTLQGGAGRRDALQEFKIFCVNLIYKLLGKNGNLEIQEPFSEPDRSLLLRTAEIWSQSVGIGA